MKTVAVVVLGMLFLTGCGKRGNLDLPPGATFPRQYPAARQPRQGRMIPVVLPENQSQDEDGTDFLPEKDKQK
ncbi:MAG: lipoprotein [Alphaproteobacteria bacterium]|nr:lipoprotein [Alphaproteobacteria bacterium]